MKDDIRRRVALKPGVTFADLAEMSDADIEKLGVIVDNDCRDPEPREERPIFVDCTCVKTHDFVDCFFGYPAGESGKVFWRAVGSPTSWPTAVTLEMLGERDSHDEWRELNAETRDAD
jgi:hypothetical protein